MLWRCSCSCFRRRTSRDRTSLGGAIGSTALERLSAGRDGTIGRVQALLWRMASQGRLHRRRGD